LRQERQPPRQREISKFRHEGLQTRYGWVVDGDGFEGGAKDGIPIVEPVGSGCRGAFFVVGLCDLSAQEVATALSNVQQSAAKSALCSAIASKFPNPAAAGPSALSDPGVLSTAASSFAGSTHLPLPSATDMIKAYAMQHATDILGSCATASATSGMVPQMPGASGLPSIPKLP
jgi:hypothetical protein